MSEPLTPAAPPYSHMNRVLVGSVMGGAVGIAIFLYFFLPLREAPPLWVPVALVAAGIAVHLALEAIGYRVEALTPGLTRDEAAAAGRERWQTSMVMRLGISESFAIVATVVAVVMPREGFLIYVCAAVVALVLLAVHAWPWSRPVIKTAEALEAAGQQSYLREDFGLEPAGPSQRL